MNYFILLLILPLVTLISCKETEKPATLADDKIVPEYKKEITAIEEDKKLLQDKNVNIQKRIADMAPNPKFSDLLRKQKFSNEKLITLIDQIHIYLELKIHEREKYLEENISRLKLTDLEKQHEDFLIDRKTNPPVYPWRKKSQAIAGSKNQKVEEPKKEEGHGGGHGAPPPAEHGGGHEAPATGHGGGH